MVWLKNLYITQPSQVNFKKQRIIASAASMAMGCYIFVSQGSLWPVIVSIIFLGLLSSDRIARLFFVFVERFIFYIFQTITLCFLTLIYYFLLTPMSYIKQAVYFVFGLEDSFFKASHRKTFEKSLSLIEFERQF